MRHRVPIGWLVAVLCTLPVHAAGRVSLHLPDPTQRAALEPLVAEQIAAAETQLDHVLAEPSPASLQLAAAYGDLGAVLHAYHLAEPAGECYAEAERLDSEGFRWPHLRGLLLQEAGRLAEAEAAFGRAVARAPGDLAAKVALGEIRLLAGRPAEAEAILREALAAAPGLSAAKALLGQAALADYRFAEAALQLEAALAEVPAANRLHYPLGLAYRGLGDSAKAAQHLKKAGSVGLLAPDPLREGLEALRTGERAHLARGQAAFAAGRLADAAAEFRRALAARPESVPARINLASALSGSGDREGAMILLRDALRTQPANATAHYNLAVLLLATGKTAEARGELTAALAVRPDDAEAHRTLARLLRETGVPGDVLTALSEYGQAIDLAPQDDVARLGEAETLVRLGRFREARGRLEEGLRALPASGLLSLGLARLLAASPDATLRDGARALELAQAVYAAQPAAAHAVAVAQALAELGRCAEAAEWQEKAVAAAGATAGAELTAPLAGYRRGTPCRPPVQVPQQAGSRS